MSRGRRIGKAFEYRVAGHLGGTLYTGTEGDVDARGYRIECKHRTDLRFESNNTLRDWMEQIHRYEEANPDQKYALAFSGGQKFQKGRIWIATDLAEFKRLTDPVENLHLLSELENIRLLLESRP